MKRVHTDVTQLKHSVSVSVYWVSDQDVHHILRVQHLLFSSGTSFSPLICKKTENNRNMKDSPRNIEKKLIKKSIGYLLSLLSV